MQQEARTPHAILDITAPISADLPVWPGDPPVDVARLPGPAPDAASVSVIRIGSHTGTHVDPPAHYVPGGKTVDRLPLDVLIGPAWVAHIRSYGPIDAHALSAAGIPARTSRLLLRTHNSDRTARGFDPDFVGLSADAAEWLLKRGIRLVGTDGPSIEPFLSPGEPVHRLLLAAGVIVLEGLCLGRVEPGYYDLVCLPLLILDGDGAPVRAILLPRQQEDRS